MFDDNSNGSSSGKQLQLDLGKSFFKTRRSMLNSQYTNSRQVRRRMKPQLELRTGQGVIVSTKPKRLRNQMTRDYIFFELSFRNLFKLTKIRKRTYILE